MDVGSQKLKSTVFAYSVFTLFLVFLKIETAFYYYVSSKCAL